MIDDLKRHKRAFALMEALSMPGHRALEHARRLGDLADADFDAYVRTSAEALEQLKTRAGVDPHAFPPQLCPSARQKARADVASYMAGVFGIPTDAEDEL